VAGTVERPVGSALADQGGERRAVAGVLVVAAVLFAAGLGVAVGAVADRRDADSTTLAVFAAGCCLVAGAALTMVASLAWAARGVGVCAKPASPGPDQDRRS
jgi:nitrate/nitrite transporter NarK